jgi:hypothetical protein
LDALSADELALLGTESSNDALSEYAPNCYPMFTPLQIQTILLRNPILPAPAPVPAPAILSPHMTAVLASSNNSSSSYSGSLKFLDFQAEFDHTFPNPIPLFVTPSFSELSASLSIDSIFASTVVHTFIDQSKFQVFLPTIYTALIMSILLTTMTPPLFTPQYKQTLKKFSMSFRNPTSGHWTNLTPDECSSYPCYSLCFLWSS